MSFGVSFQKRLFVNCVTKYLRCLSKAGQVHVSTNQKLATPTLTPRTPALADLHPTLGALPGHTLSTYPLWPLTGLPWFVVRGRRRGRVVLHRRGELHRSCPWQGQFQQRAAGTNERRVRTWQEHSVCRDERRGSHCRYSAFSLLGLCVVKYQNHKTSGLERHTEAT